MQVSHKVILWNVKQSLIAVVNEVFYFYMTLLLDVRDILNPINKNTHSLLNMLPSFGQMCVKINQDLSHSHNSHRLAISMIWMIIHMHPYDCNKQV